VALSLPDHWLWDFWIADDRTAYHLFFLKAPRVGDPDLRHWNTSVGHAFSTDLVQWQVVADALTPSTEPDCLVCRDPPAARGPEGRPGSGDGRWPR